MRKSFLRVGRFLVVVWLVAIAFQGLVEGLPSLPLWAVDAGLLAPSVALPSSATQCSDLGQVVPPTSLEPSVARALSWRLGLLLGKAVGLRNIQIAKPDDLAEIRPDLDKLAHLLGIPTPELPPVKHLADAVHEFSYYLENDPQCIAARLSLGYGRKAGATYQFAAAMGHASIYRSLAPRTPWFVRELRAYGAAADISPDLWVVFRSDLSSTPQSKVGQELEEAVQNVQRYLDQEADSAGSTEPQRNDRE